MPKMDGSLFINMNIIKYNWYIAGISEARASG